MSNVNIGGLSIEEARQRVRQYSEGLKRRLRAAHFRLGAVSQQLDEARDVVDQLEAAYEQASLTLDEVEAEARAAGLESISWEGADVRRALEDAGADVLEVGDPQPPRSSWEGDDGC